MKQINSIKDIKETDSYAIFMRHGNRDKIPEGVFGNEVELNSLGEQRAFEYGQSLQHLNIRHIYTSPVKRCIQTAEHIVRGLSREVPIEISTILGEPGAFVHDGKTAGQNFLKLGMREMYYTLVRREEIEGFRNLNEGSELLNNFFIEQAKAPGVNIYVSHDLLVALYKFHCYNRLHTFEDWVGYLEGPIIHINSEP